MKTFPQRKSPRLRDYDYAQEGAYFVTICTAQREHLFGDVVGDDVELSDIGGCVQSCWLAIPYHFNHVYLDMFVIMPNHIHGILIITDIRRGDACVPRDKPNTTNEQRSGHEEKQRSGHEEKQRSGHEEKQRSGHAPTLRNGTSLSTIVGSFKSSVTREARRITNDPHLIVWQRSYHDHIIRDEADLNRLREYVQNNPSRWTEDRFYG